MIGRGGVGGPDVLVDEGPESAARDQRGIEIPHRPGRDVARVGVERLAGVSPLLIDAVERRSRQKDLAPHFVRLASPQWSETGKIYDFPQDRVLTPQGPA